MAHKIFVRWRAAVGGGELCGEVLSAWRVNIARNILLQNYVNMGSKSYVITITHVPIFPKG